MGPVWFFISWGHRRERDLGETYPVYCEYCDNDVYYRFLKRSSYILLFLLPIPTGRKYFLFCPVCETGLRIKSKAHREKVKQQAELTDKFLNDEIDQEEYEQRTQEFDSVFRNLIESADGVPTIASPQSTEEKPDYDENEIYATECYFCKDELTSVAFLCNDCGEVFCSEHRRTEDHNCSHRLGETEGTSYETYNVRR